MSLMIQALIGLLGVCIILLFSEILWRKKRLRGERARKFVHITVGSFVATWPFFMSFRAVQLISAAMLAVVLVSRYLKVFKGIHSVRRKTSGDVFYPVSIGLVATFAASEWVFAAAILHLSLADGLAAVIGDRYGKRSRYKVFKETKSIPGTFTFWLVSTLIVASILLLAGIGQSGLSWTVLLWLPAGAAILENLSPRGADNLIVPFVIMVVLNWLQVVGESIATGL